MHNQCSLKRHTIRNNLSREEYIGSLHFNVSLPFLLHLARVDDIHHVVNGYRGLCNVCGDDDLCDTLRGPAENRLLLLV